MSIDDSCTLRDHYLVCVPYALDQSCTNNNNSVPNEILVQPPRLHREHRRVRDGQHVRVGVLDGSVIAGSDGGRVGVLFEPPNIRWVRNMYFLHIEQILHA